MGTLKSYKRFIEAFSKKISKANEMFVGHRFS
jgi:hypothetical protein